MSHTAVLKVDFNDRDALKAACQRLGLTFKEGKHRAQLFDGGHDCDFSVKLPGWHYPIAINGDQLKYDDYNGRWGSMKELEKLQDAYSREVTVKMAQSMGMSYTEETGENGEIILNLYDYSG